MKKINWKVGQIVYTDKNGKGVIEDIVVENAYLKIYVDFENHTTDSFDLGGCSYSSEDRTLWFSPRIITDEMLYPPVWKPTQGGVYYYIDTVGMVTRCNFSGSETDKMRVECGNCFENEYLAGESDYFKFYEKMRNKTEEE